MKRPGDTIWAWIMITLMLIRWAHAPARGIVLAAFAVGAWYNWRSEKTDA